ncbi:MAG: PEGA domain-containing protein [Candidatus Scalindua sp.]
MKSKTTKPYRHCPEEEYEISIFICRGRQKAHYPKCSKCEFRTTTEEISPIPVKKETEEPLPSRQTSTGSIMVKSEPLSAEIYLDDDNIGVTPAIVTQILPGKYKIKIKMAGYEVWSQSVDVKANKETSLTAVLQGKDGSIVMESKPTKAEIFIDGNNAGITPVIINNVKPGKHFVEVKLFGYETWSKDINVEAEKETSLTAELTTEYGSISLSSEPTKAKIFLDNIEVSTTPANLRSVPHGTHVVEVRMEGYNVWKQDVNVELGKEMVLTAILQVKTGSASIKSQPKNARIYLDGKHAGTTPASIPSIIPGTHEIKVKMDAYDVWSETVNIEAGKENVINAVLQRSTGSLMVESDPANAMILVDGKEIGHTPEIIMSSAKGTHVVEVRMDGYDIWKENIEIEPGTEKSLTATLQLKTGSLIINSKPSGGTICLDGKEAGIAPSNIKGLQLGAHLVEVKLDGYEVWSEGVTVNADKENKLTAVLQILTGSLNIKSEPSNAIVVVDGNEVGNSPVSITDLIPGKHIVEVRMDGYATWSESVDVVHSKEASLTAELQQLKGSVNIKSDPTNATIIVDGNEVGNTPAGIADLVPGKHLVEVIMEGYSSWSESVEISTGKENHITAVLQQLTGSLNIKSEPENAMIIVDGNEVGNTPIVIADLNPGKHLIEVMMEGYSNWSENVEVRVGKENHITAVLQQLTGSLNIKSEPENAIIIVDGKKVGNSPVSKTDLVPGKHHVEIRMEGYEGWSDSVEISAGKENHITAVLQQLAGSVNIESEPANAIIIVDGNEVGNAPANIADLVPGKHLVEVRMNGYENWRESVNIDSGQEVALTVVLKIIPGSLCISSEPSGAVIFIDSKEAGTTPLTITDPDQGKHLVEVKKDGYEIWSENVEIEMGKDASLTAVLQLKAGSFTINSVPSDAMIFIDGKEIDTTPLTITDPATGKHSVEAKMDGYETWSESINIVPGKAIALTATLQIKAGTVSISSEPSDAVVFIDGKEVGRTPVVITDPSPGTHTVELKMDEFETWSDSVDIKPGKEVILTAVLQPKAGSVCIKSNPPNAMAFIEGKEIGTTPVIITNSSPGTYLVEIKMDGYETWNESVNIEQGKEITITADLQMKAGSININSNPSDATIHLDGKMVGKTPETIADLSHGMHLVEVMMEGYEPWSKNVDVKGDKENTLIATLQKITGSINIKSNPPEAVIYLDGEKVGTTPDTLQSVDIGVHNVEVKMEGYAEWKKSLSVRKGKEIVLTAALQLNTGTARIESDPTQAIVSLDGKEVGKTPVSLTGIQIGVYEIELQKAGYVSWKKSIKIKAGKVNALTAKLMEMTGSVNIDSKPSNAIVCIDSKEIGNTPAIITDLIAGKHLVEVKMEGYEMWSDNVIIDPGKEYVVTAELQMKPGTVSVNSEPPNAMILIDSNEVGTTPEIITDLSFEKHLVEVRMDGYEVWSESINVEQGIELNVTAELQMKAGSVSINSEPSGAIILIDNKNAGTTPKTLTGITPGKHHVEVAKDGFETWVESVDVRGEKENILKATLKEITGSISIKSNPSEVTIFLDGKEVGTTPDTIRSVAIGIHEIEIKKDGYAVWKKKTNVKNGKEIALNAVLQPITGSARLESEPTGALIFLDGENVGKTPKIITGIKTGKHEVEVRLDGYDSWMKMIKIKADREYLFTAALQRRRGSLMLISNPSNAIIYIEGKKSGKTPKAITELIPGNYTVEVKLDEYQTWSENIDVEPGKETTLKAVLQAKPGSINIKSKPSDAKILIDGNEAGTTPETIDDIESGAHTVELMVEGYDVWSVSVDVKANKQSYLTAELQQMTGSISIKSEPSNAVVLIDGKKAGTTPAIIKDLSQGTHQVNISVDGYNVWSENVEIEAKKENGLSVVLQEMTGTVTIDSTPADALILIDGKKAGTTPETISDIKAGMHLVEISIDGYEDWSENIEVTDKEYNITATLQEITGSIDIKSEPSNATILVDGKKIGLTPETIKNLKPGIHLVEVTMDGCENWSNSVEVTSEKQSTVTALLKKATGSVSITSTPVEARIYIDGEEVGTTPTTLSSIPIGTHKIEVKIGGHEDWKKSIIIKKEKEMSLNAVLQLNIGSISIESYPENAIINLDGKDVGKAPKRLTDIIVGTHEVEVLLDGYVTWKKTIKVKAEKEISLSADLKKVSDTIEIKADDTMTTPEIVKPITHETTAIEVKPEKVEEKIITKPQKPEPSSGDKKTQPPPGELIKLRSTYDKISNSQIESLPFITISEENNNIIFCHSSINHRYEEKPIGDGDVIIDHTTGLMWYQSGSSDYFSLKKANKWLKKTNKNSYAGFDDWRLPTLEEASSLLEFETKDGNFIDLVFDNKQWGTWTGDKSDRGQAWIVTYVNGTINQVPVGTPATFVRPVRSLNI